jgi:hypothetical protein
MENIFVSLGSNCSVAYQLKEYGLREKAYPFDWCKTSLSQLILTLRNNFNDFEKLEIKKYSENHHSLNNNCGSYILFNKYGIQFAHELIDKYDINDFSLKLINRITNFRELRNPIFIRIETSNMNSNKIKLYDELVKLLDSIFNNYKLIVISNQYLINSKIINYKLEEFDKDWKYLTVKWNNILSLNFF